MSLERGLERIRGGWCQGGRKKYGETGIRYCALGALDTLEISDYSNNRDKLADVIMAQYPSYRNIYLHARSLVAEGYAKAKVVMQFNDAPGRTQGEVIAVFEKAIANETVS